MEKEGVTIIVETPYYDKILSAFIIGNGYLSMGVDVSMFFTFWGLNSLKKGKMGKQPLSYMNFLGLGRLMIKNKMKKYGVASLPELAKLYKEIGGKIIACTMTMELMGIKKEDLDGSLIDGYGGVGKYVADSLNATKTLYI